MTELGDGRGSSANNLKLQLEVSNSLGLIIFLALLIAQKRDGFIYLFFNIRITCQMFLQTNCRYPDNCGLKLLL